MKILFIFSPYKILVDIQVEITSTREIFLLLLFCYVCFTTHSLSLSKPKLLLSWLLIRERGIFMTRTSQEEIGWPRFCGYQTSNCHLRYVAVSAHTYVTAGLMWRHCQRERNWSTGFCYLFYSLIGKLDFRVLRKSRNLLSFFLSIVVGPESFVSVIDRDSKWHLRDKNRKKESKKNSMPELSFFSSILLIVNPLCVLSIRAASIHS